MPIPIDYGVIVYEPYLGPKEFGDLLPEMFKSYASYETDRFPFNFLQTMPEFKAVCKDITAPKPTFVVTPALEQAIRQSSRINSPGTGVYSSGPPSDGGWAAWMGDTVASLAEETNINGGKKP